MVNGHIAFRSKTAWVALAVALVSTACGGGGGNGGGTAAVTSTPSTASVAYPESLLLGSVSTVSLSVAAASTAGAYVMISPVAAPLVTIGNNRLAASYRPAAFAGAGVACVSGAGNTIGTLTGVNQGVDIKSAALLLDGSWAQAASAAQAWTTLGAASAVFDGWENCGVKAEGAPSPSSTLTVAADGSFTDNVFDGNPSTTVSIVNRSYSVAQANAMLSAQGYLDTTQTANPTQVYLRIYRNAAGQTVLEEQGIPASGASASNPGYVAIYFQR